MNKFYNVFVRNFMFLTYFVCVLSYKTFVIYFAIFIDAFVLLALQIFSRFQLK